MQKKERIAASCTTRRSLKVTTGIYTYDVQFSICSLYVSWPVSRTISSRIASNMYTTYIIILCWKLAAIANPSISLPVILLFR